MPGKTVELAKGELVKENIRGTAAISPSLVFFSFLVSWKTLGLGGRECQDTDSTALFSPSMLLITPYLTR